MQCDKRTFHLFATLLSMITKSLDLSMQTVQLFTAKKMYNF